MKVVINKISLIFRLGVTVTAMLFAQQAMAVGANAGDPVNNTATVSYDVGLVSQTPIPAAAPQFLIDRRVDFSVTSDTDSEIVAPGALNLTFDFIVQNDSNSTMDFEITLRQMIPADGEINGIVGSTDADVDVDTIVFTDYIDDLAEDGNITVTINGDDVAYAWVNTSVANIEITVTAFDPSGVDGGRIPLDDTSASPDDPDEIDNVLADADNNGLETAADGVIVQSADLVITKAVLVISDPVNGVDVNAKAIPGAVLEYTITIDNTLGAVPAIGISIADLVDSNVLFLNATNDPIAPPNEPYNGGTANIEFSSGTWCLADAGDGNTDGCTLAGGDNLTLAGSDMASGPILPIDVAAGATLDITFQVLVPIL